MSKSTIGGCIERMERIGVVTLGTQVAKSIQFAPEIR
jgi:hypothetical protein